MNFEIPGIFQVRTVSDFRSFMLDLEVLGDYQSQHIII